MTTLDLLIRGAKVVRAGQDEPAALDIGVRGGVIVELAGGLDAGEAAEVVDASGLLAFPGVVDAHQHWGIYNELGVDTDSESRACAQGGVTTALTYMRTGQYYLWKSGPYREFYPEVLERAAGRAFVDYGFHLAPMMKEHIAELPSIVDDFGVTSFKIFMFYGAHGLHGRSNDQSQFLLTPPGERYDIAHFEFVMRGLQHLRGERPELADVLSLSMHCETAEIMAAYTALVEEAGDLSGLAAYSASRPQHSEGLAITIASYLAYETGLPTINLLHLSSAKAFDAAMKMAQVFPDVDFRREVTIGHLCVDLEEAEANAGNGGKVNPPLRPRSDVEALWEHVLAGHVDWVASDHACCREEQKFGTPAEDVFLAKSGFGGAEYLLPALITEGTKRGLTYGRIAELVATNPARRFGLARRKGDIAVGLDADIALVDPQQSWTVRAADSASTQEYTPFEGMRLDAAVRHTVLRGARVLSDGKIAGKPMGEYLFRPLADG